MEDLGRAERKGSRWRTANGQQISGPVKIRESNLESSFRLINLCGDLFISVEQVYGLHIHDTRAYRKKLFRTFIVNMRNSQGSQQLSRKYVTYLIFARITKTAQTPMRP